MAPDTVWEIVFLMVILKIPIVYLCYVIWWGIKAKPTPEDGAPVVAQLGDEPPRGPRRVRPPRPRPQHPGGRPARTYARTAASPAAARAKLDR